MKKLLVLIMGIIVVSGCFSDRNLPECYRDPAYRDSVLLANNVTSYGKEASQSLFEDMRYAFLAEAKEMTAAEETSLVTYKSGLEGVSEEDLKFMKYLYKEYAELAVVAEYVYKDSQVQLPEGWTDMAESDPQVDSIIKRYADETSFALGLKCSLLSKDDRYVLAFAGTDFPADWKDFKQVMHFIRDAYEDIDGAFSDDASQVALASALVERLLFENKVSKDRLEFTGHSLGGRLASEMAARFGCPATVFNAAGVSPSLYSEYEAMRTGASKGWRGYIVDITSANDQLTCLQKYVSGSSDPYLSAFASQASSDKGVVENLLSLGKNLWDLVTDQATSRSTIFESIAAVMGDYYNRDYRAIGAHLNIEESMSGHSIKPLADYLNARSEACAKELKRR